MKNRLHLSFQKGDLIPIFVILIVAFGILFAFASMDNSGNNQALQVYQDGRLVKELSLTQDFTFQVSGDYTNTITIENGKASITNSDCPGEDCVYSGWISSIGRSIVCLPNRVELRITGIESDVDFAVG